MKIVIILLLLTAAQCQASWFNHDEYKDRWQQAEQKLEQQRQLTGQWQLASAVLGTACIGLLVIGAAIGAKARKAAKHE